MASGLPGMGGKGGGQPAPPDPVTTINAQGNANINAAIASGIMNNVNQTTPYGNLRYNQIGSQTVDGREIPRWEATTTLTPEQQAIFNTQQGITRRVSDLGSAYTDRIAAATAQPYNFDGMPEAPVYDEKLRQQARDGIIARDQPNMDRDREALRTSLANSGIGLGSEAYGAAQDDFNRGQNDFRMAADNASYGEAARAYGLGAQTRDRAIAEMTNLRSQPINEVSALLGVGGGVKPPDFVNGGNYQVQPTDVGGIYANDYAARMGGYGIDSKTNSSMMGSVFGLLGTLGGSYFGGPFGGMAGGMLGRGIGGGFSRGGAGQQMGVGN